MLKFKLDENLPAEAAQVLSDAGYDAVTVLDQSLGGQPDPNISAVCLEEGRAIVTLYVGFSNIRNYPPEEFAGIVVLRLRRQDKHHILSVLSRLTQTLASEKLSGKLWIVDETTVRVRS